MPAFFARCIALLGVVACCSNWNLAEAQDGSAPSKRIQVKIVDDKKAFAEAVMPIDPVKRIQYQAQGNLGVRLTYQGKMLHLGYIYTFFHIDGQVVYVGQDGRINAFNMMQKLPKTPGGKDRDGFMATYNHGKLKVTQLVEVAPCKAAPGQKRKLDACIVRYIVENTDDRPHKFGMRVGMDVYISTNDGALFASPTTHPGKILDGVELKDKAVPDYVQGLERPDLKNPGFVAVYTFNLGKKIERASRVVLTSLGAPSLDGYNLQAVPAMGDSAMSMYWDPKDIPPKGKREMAYAYGGGIAMSPEPEGLVSLDLGGSFDPGKTFTLRAYVNDPAPGQTLQLELSPGLERVEGKEIQPVASSDADFTSMVLWKVRVLKLGEHPIRVRSSTGATVGKVVAVSQGS